MSNLTVQKVNGLIKRSPVTFTSHKLPSSARGVRTAGLYVRKNFDGQIMVGFATRGYKHIEERRSEIMQQFLDFIEAEGYTLKAGHLFGEFPIERKN